MDAPAVPATAPVRAFTRPIEHRGANDRVLRVTMQVVITLKNGTEIECPHGHGHRTKDAVRKCAQVIINRANKAAGIAPK